MQAVGIIVEYNPFHNGHAYHLQQAKQQTGADCVIAVMSGHFLQRGEPALVSKWSRTRMALAAGADLVVELPYAFSTQKAETFASGAISILESLHADFVCFGSENGNIDSFTRTADLLEAHESELSALIQQEMKKGNSYPKAASNAFLQLFTEAPIDLSQPNNVLGMSYVAAIKKQHASIKPYTITRIQSHYHDDSLSSSFISSATSIRKAIFDSSSHGDLSKHMPVSTANELTAYKQAHGQFHHWEHYFPFLKYKLLTTPLYDLQRIYEIEEGIEHRLLSYISSATSFEDFLTKVKTKRYTRTRLQRMCVHLLTNTTKSEMQQADPYIRLLGMSKTGQGYLKTIKKKLSLPIVSTVSQCKLKEIDIDIKATHVYSMPFQEPLRSQFMKQEYTQPPIIWP